MRSGLLTAAMLAGLLLAALAVPAVAFASDPAGQDRENAARACKALRASMGAVTFGQTYGTVQSNRRLRQVRLAVDAHRAPGPPERAR
jgi:hypothetical protein